jgi:hypothetical protein
MLSSVDKHTALAFFLLKETGSVCGVWRGTMSAKDQRALFGRFLGKGTLIINGETERVKMIVKVCFGTDFDTRADIAWRDL